MNLQLAVVAPLIKKSQKQAVEFKRLLMRLETRPKMNFFL